MCTLTWWRENDRYALYFNRDELKTRAPALPPEIREAAGVPFITPTDPDRGGTWLLVNGHGLSVGILNYYQGAPVDTSLDLLSRGQLVLSLAPRTSVREVGAELESLPAAEYPPFLLFAMSVAEAPALWKWRGEGGGLSREEDVILPLTTSSYRPLDACAHRKARFEEIPAGLRNPEALQDYHDSTDPEDSAFSVRMRRNDAQTVSVNKIEVCPGEAVFTYRPEPAGTLEMLEPVRVVIPRVHS